MKKLTLPARRQVLFYTILFFILNISYSFAQQHGKVIDQIAAIVGSNVILKSNIESQYLQYRLQGNIEGDTSMKCQILEELLFQKLLLNQAEVDSIEVTDAQVESEMDRRLRYFISQIGSQEKLEKFYNKSILEIKEEFRDLVKSQLLVESMKSKITKDIKITPSEVKAYFKSIPKDSIPLINSEFEIGEIVKKPPITLEEKEDVKNKLRTLRKRVINGESFATLALLYSEDPGSAKKGGELGFHARGELYPEFEAAAFNLKGNEVSDIVKTKAGYHIIQLIKRKGDYINVRHILLKPEVSVLDMAKARIFLDSVANIIKNDSMTFEKAALRFSDSPDRINGGLMVNPITGDTKFEANQLEPDVFFIIDKLKVGEVSRPVIMTTTENNKAYRLLYLKERTLPHRANLKEDYDKIQSWALQKKQNKVIQDWIENKISDTYIKINDKYKYCKFKHHWVN